jgi:hypothetical protein
MNRSEVGTLQVRCDVNTQHKPRRNESTLGNRMIRHKRESLWGSNVSIVYRKFILGPGKGWVQLDNPYSRFMKLWVATSCVVATYTKEYGRFLKNYSKCSYIHTQFWQDSNSVRYNIRAFGKRCCSRRNISRIMLRN